MSDDRQQPARTDHHLPPAPFPGQHPYAHHWPAYTPPPPKPETTLRAPLLWTAVFSLVGVLAFAVLVAAALFLAYALIWLLVASLSGEQWDFWGALADSDWSAAIAPVALVVLLASVIAFVVCAGVLLLLRRIESVRRWAPALQGLTACGITYVGGSALASILGQFASALSGG